MHYMNFEYDLDEESEIVSLTVSGTCSIQELEHVMKTLLADKTINYEHDFVTDFRDCKFDFQPSDMTNFFQLFQPGSGGKKGRSAILVSRPLETAMMFMHRMKVANVRTAEIFSTREAGVAWLMAQREKDKSQ